MPYRIFFITLIAFLLPQTLHAAAVSPAIIDLEGGRGETVSAVMNVINTQSEAQTYYLGTLSFHAKNESGEPEFSEANNTDGLSTWIVLPAEKISVPARSKVEVPFTVAIPADIASGSYQSSITVSVTPSEVVATNGAIIEAKTAVLVFLNVKGETQKKAALLDFVHTGNKIVTRLPSTFTFRIQNQGNVYAIPEGTIAYTDLFGRTLFSQNANEAKHRILPMSTRTFSILRQKPEGFLATLRDQIQAFSIGPVRATLTLNLGEGFEEIHARTSIWYVPYQLILSVLALFSILKLGYHIISKHQKK